MVYTSKRRKFKDFVRTNNWRYYLIFLLIFATLVTTVVIITRKNRNESNNPTNNTTDIPSNDVTDNDDNNNTHIRGRYKLCINTAIYQISVYEWDNNTNSYKTEVHKYMPVSPDIDIEAGEYTFNSDTMTKETWYTTANGKHYRYTTNFNDAISFHSAEYSEYNDKNSLVKDSYSNIGTAKSSDGFQLLCVDAKWIYENCSYASEITVYSDESEPVSSQITKVIELAPGLSWDPTDISSSSPYCNTTLKELKCLHDNVTVNPGTDIANLFKYVKAIDVDDKNINNYIYTTTNGKLEDIKEYTIRFYIADIFGNVLFDDLIVEVVEPELPSEDESESVEDESAEDESNEISEDASENNPEEGTEDSTEQPSDDIPSESVPDGPTEESNEDNINS